MDNITHSLIGLMTGASFAHATSGQKSALSAAPRRALIVGIAIAANNLPDLDLVYSSTGGLRYLLEHRGYTHTIVGCALLAMLLYAVTAWLLRRKVTLTRADHAAFVGVSLGGVTLHLAMDALNSYGVHPFWPLQNRWIFGDSVFIVEPLYWAAAAPLLFELRSRSARIVLGCLLALAIVVSAVSGRVAAPILVLFAALVVLLIAAGWWLGPRAASLLSVGLFVLITLMFIYAGRIAAARIEAAASADFPEDRRLDHVLTPMPMNPLCWEVLLLELHGETYAARRTVVSLAPQILAAAACGRSSSQTLVPRTRLPPSRSGIDWDEFSMPAVELKKLSASSCEVAALLRFARAPFALSSREGWTLGDLRFDRGPKMGLSDIHIGDAPDPSACPWTPPWVPPREDLLRR